MKTTILETHQYQEFLAIIDNMYRLGWHERNSGNISFMVDDEDILKQITNYDVKRTVYMKDQFPNLIDKYFIVTGSGEHFRNIYKFPEEKTGIIKIRKDGQSFDIVWGFGKEGLPTSEIHTHLMVHNLKIQQNKNHRVVMHAHATNLLAMSFIHDLDDREFTKTLWKMSTECIVVFPEGVGVLPWMVCGNSSIGKKTVKKMKDVNAVIWSLHGVFAAGNSIDDTFGLIEAMEKSAEVYMKTKNSEVKQVITDSQLKDLANAFNVTPREGYLDEIEVCL